MNKIERKEKHLAELFALLRSFHILRAATELEKSNQTAEHERQYG